MGSLVTIGDFSRASHLTVKTLRHYHDAGLLEPNEIDPTAAIATSHATRSRPPR
jgi:hypothetical protein